MREDYSERGTAWDYFPHDHARSRAYRWNEDGLAGICDDQQTFCFALALWNGKDPILKERIFGLGGPEGNHGEDAKEYWWYLDSTPTHSWMRWRYHYPQAEFPYDRPRAGSTPPAGREEPEYELVDTGVFDENRYWAVTVDYAKAGPTDMCVERRRSPTAARTTATLHVLPHAVVPQHLGLGPARPGRRAHASRARRRHASSPTTSTWAASCSPAEGAPRRRWSATTRPTRERLWGLENRTPVPEGRRSTTT